jgi:hypothetical protein
MGRRKHKRRKLGKQAEVQKDKGSDHVERIIPIQTPSPAEIVKCKVPQNNTADQRTYTKPYWPPSGWVYSSFCNPNFWIALFTAALLVVSYYQWRTSQDAVVVASEALNISKLDQRAWTSVKNISMVTFELNKPIVIQITINNIGKTVARDVASVIHVIEVRGRPNIDKVSRELNIKRSDNLVLFPNAELTRTRESFVPDSDKFARMKSKESELYVFGDITYSDVFGDEHITEFCGLYSVQMAAFILCDQHQHAT